MNLLENYQVSVPALKLPQLFLNTVSILHSHWILHCNLIILYLKEVLEL